MLSRLSLNGGCRVLLKSNVASQKITMCKFGQLTCRKSQSPLKNTTVFDVYKRSNVLRILSVRHESTDNATPQKALLSEIPDARTDDATPQKALSEISGANTSDATSQKALLSEIPDPPAPHVEEVIEKVIKFHENGETTFSSIGLGGNTPVGIVENCLEWLHIGGGLPWWGAIAVGTLCVRLAIFPLVILTQRNVARMNNVMPQIQEIQLKMSEARLSGNQYEAAMHAQDLYKFWKDNNISPYKNFAVMIIQLPVFLSFFMALRKMSNLPVESLREGGLWWFTDLTIPDPYYALPVITCLTLLTTIEVGTDTAAAHMTGMMKYFFRAVPFVMFPFIINFPGALLCYWVSTNFISLIQVGAMKTPKVREFLNIPKLKRHTKKDLPMQPKSFVDGLQNSWTNVKIAKQLADRDRADAIQFNNAAKGPLKKTYKYDPTKQVPTAVSILAKKR